MSNEKLYRVDWSGECYVMAKNEREAEQVALDEVGFADDFGLCADAEAVDKNEVPPPEWVKSIPYCREDDKTVGEILAEMEAP